MVIVWSSMINLWPAVLTVFGFISLTVGIAVGGLAIRKEVKQTRAEAIAREVRDSAWRTWVTNEIAWMNTALVVCLECNPSINKGEMISIFKQHHTDENGRIKPLSNPNYPLCPLEQYVSKLLESE